MCGKKLRGCPVTDPSDLAYLCRCGLVSHKICIADEPCRSCKRLPFNREMVRRRLAQTFFHQLDEHDEASGGVGDMGFLYDSATEAQVLAKECWFWQLAEVRDRNWENKLEAMRVAKSRGCRLNALAAEMALEQVGTGLEKKRQNQATTAAASTTTASTTTVSTTTAPPAKRKMMMVKKSHSVIRQSAAAGVKLKN